MPPEDKNRTIQNPHQSSHDEWISLAEAARAVPYTAEYLSLLARKKSLPAKKIRGVWYTTLPIVKEYMRRQMSRVLRPAAAGLREPTASMENSFARTGLASQGPSLLEFPTDAPSEDEPLVPPEQVQKINEDIFFENIISQVAQSTGEDVKEMSGIPTFPIFPRTPSSPPPRRGGAPPHSHIEEMKTLKGDTREFASKIVGGVEDELLKKESERSDIPRALGEEELLKIVKEQSGSLAPGEDAYSNILFQKFLTTFTAFLNKEVEARESFLARAWHTIRGAYAAVLSHRKLFSLFLIFLLIFSVLPFRVVSAFFDSAYRSVAEVVNDANTVLGFRPGTSANEILLLDQEGKVAIFGNVETEGQFKSFAEEGIAPIYVKSMTKVENLNADYFDNLSSEEFTLAFVTKNGNTTYDNVFLEGKVAVGQTLLVRGAANLLSSLSVDGELSVFGNANLYGDTTLYKDLTVNGPARFKNVLSAQEIFANAGTFAESLLTHGNLTVNGQAVVQGFGIFQGGVSADTGTFRHGVSTGGPLQARGDVVLGGTDSDISLTSVLWSIDAEGNAIFSGDATIKDSLSVSATTSVNRLRASNIGIGTTTPGYEIGVVGSGLFEGLVIAYEGFVGNTITATSTLSAEGLASFLAGFISSASSTISSTLHVLDALTASSSLVVDGLAELYGGFMSIASSTIAAPLHVSDNLSASSTITVGGLATFENGFISGASSSATILSASDSLYASSSIAVDGMSLFALTGGSVGIGTTTPGTLLAVQGDAFINDNLTVGGAFSATSTLRVDDLSTLNGFISYASSTVSAPFHVSDHLSASSTLTLAGLGTFEGGGILGGASSTISGTLALTNNVIANSGGIDIGDAGTRFGILYADEVNASTLVGIITGGNSSSTTFTINSENGTADEDDSFLAFERGTEVPNALLKWDSANDNFVFNFGIIAQASSTVSGPFHVSDHLSASSTLTVGGLATFDLGFISSASSTVSAPFHVSDVITSSSSIAVDGGALFALTGGNVGIGTGTPSVALEIDSDAQTSLQITGHFDSAFPEARILTRASRGSRTAQTAVQNGDRLALLSFNGYDGDSYFTAASLEVDVDGAVADGSVPASIRFATNAAGETNRTERMRITSDGNVGIGTTTPISKLSIEDLDDAAGDHLAIVIANSDVVGGIELETPSATVLGEGILNFGLNTNRGILEKGDEPTGAWFRVDTRASSNRFSWFWEGAGGGTESELMSLKDSGRLGLRDATPDFVFEISTTTAPDYFGISNAADGDIFVVNSSGNVGIGTTTPSGLFVAAGNPTYRGVSAGQAVLAATTANGPSLWLGTNSSGSTYDGNEWQILAGGSGNTGILGSGATGSFGIIDRTNSSARFVIDNTGNVGIGTTSPSAALAVTNATGEYSFWVNDTTTDTTPFVIDGAGNVGIGTDAPNYKLVVNGNTAEPQAFAGATAQFVLNDNNNTIVVIDQHGATQGSPILSFRNSSGTAASPGATELNRNLGLLQFYGYGTTGYSSTRRAQIAVSAAETWTDSAQGTYMQFSTTPVGSVTMAERMRIDSSGNVGIGTTSPSAALSVTGTGEYVMYVNDETTDVSPFVIDGSGNVGIGTAAPISLLDVAGTVTVAQIIQGDTTDGVVVVQGGITGGTGANLELYGGAHATTPNLLVVDADKILFRDADGSPTNVTFDTGGNVGIGTTTPVDILDINAASPIVMIKDTATGLATASSTLRLAESGANGVVDNYWDISANPQGSNFAFHIFNSSLGTNALTIAQANNNVGIGTAGPQRSLHIVGSDGAVDTFPSALGAKDFLIIENNGNTNFGLVADQSALSAIKFYDDGATGFEGIIEYSHTTNSMGFGVNQGGSTVHNMFIQSDGNVGIGTTAPTSTLQVSGALDVTSENTGITLENAGRVWRMVQGGKCGTTAAGNTAYLNFCWSNMNGTYSPLYTFAHTGEMGIGTTSPWGKLSITQTGTAGDPAFIVEDSPSPDTTPFIITQTGDVGIGTTTPSEKLDVNGIIRSGGVEGVTSGGLYIPDISNSSLRIALDNATAGYSTIVNAWGNSSNPGIVVGTTRTDGVAFQVGTGITKDADQLPNSNGTAAFIVGGNGNVGIGTASPAATLDIVGGFLTTASSTVGGTLHVLNNLSASSSLTLADDLRFDSGSVINWNAGDVTITHAANTLTFAGAASGFSFSDLNITNVGDLNLDTITYDGATIQIGDSDGDPNITLTDGAGIAMLLGATAGDDFTIDTSAFVVEGDTGNVGIGTTTPSAALSVMGTGEYVVYIEDETNDTTPSFVIEGSGNVGIMTSNPGASLDVNGSLRATQITSTGLVSSATTMSAGSTMNINTLNSLPSTGRVLCADSTGASNVFVNGTDTGDCTVSSARYKHDITDLDLGLDTLLAFRPVRFKYNADERESIGLIAEEVLETEKLFVSYEDDGITPRSVHYNIMPALFIKAFQEMNARVDLVSAPTTTPSIAIDENGFVSTAKNFIAGRTLYVRDDTGFVGIGTSTPAYPLHVAGDIAANSFINVSARDTKTRITRIDDSNNANCENRKDGPCGELSTGFVDKIKNLPIFTYRYTYEADDAPLRMGLIAEESPAEVLSADKKGVDLYKLITFVTGGMKELIAKVENLESGILNLAEKIARIDERLTVVENLSARSGLFPSAENASSSRPDLATGLPQPSSETLLEFSTAATSTAEQIAYDIRYTIYDILNTTMDFGMTIVDGAMNFTNLVVNELLVQKLVVENMTANALTLGNASNRAGITMYDKNTGAPFCLSVINGNVATESGSCENLKDGPYGELSTTTVENPDVAASSAQIQDSSTQSATSTAEITTESATTTSSFQLLDSLLQEEATTTETTAVENSDARTGLVPQGPSLLEFSTTDEAVTETETTPAEEIVSAEPTTETEITVEE